MPKSEKDKADSSSVATPLLKQEVIDAATADGQAAAHVFGLPELRDKTGRQGGDVAGLGTGSSIDFHDHRLYLPGDDVRHINWQAYGRTGTYSMKLFREEVQPLVDIVCDLSHSMFYLPEKAQRTAELLAFAGFAAARAQASTRVWGIHPSGQILPAQVDEILTARWENLLSPSSLPTDEKPWAGDLSAVPFRRGSVRIYLGDLLHDSPPGQTLLPLANGAGLLLLWAPFCQDEADPAWSDACELEEVEDATRLPVWADSAMRKRYREAYSRHFELWTGEVRQLGGRIVRIPSELPLHDSLLQVAGEDRAIRLSR